MAADQTNLWRHRLKRNVPMVFKSDVKVFVQIVARSLRGWSSGHFATSADLILALISFRETFVNTPAFLEPTTELQVI